jgi:hypothetical protein
MLASIEAHVGPQAVLIDARAGLHDLSAAALVSLQAHNLLFAIDTAQTWTGYRHLFRHWQREHPGWRELRERLQLVMGQVPELNRQRYLDRFRSSAYDVLSDHCYDEVGANEVGEFHPARDAQEAPHVGWQINWSAVFQTYDPVGSPATAEQVDSCFGDFLRRATARLFATEGDSDP